jgi:hypothetical protein
MLFVAEAQRAAQDASTWSGFATATALSAKPGAERDSGDSAVSWFLQYCDDTGYTVPSNPSLDELETPEDGNPGAGRMFDFCWWLVAQGADPTTTTIPGYISTVRQRCFIRYGWQFIQSPVLQQFLMRANQYPREKRFRDPATRKLIEGVAFDDDVGIAIKAAIMVAWDGLLRVSEYLPQERWSTQPEFSLLRRDVEVVKEGKLDGYRIRLKRSKSDRYNSGQWHYFLRRIGDPTCPVRILDEYIQYRDRVFGQHGQDVPFFIRPRMISRRGYPSFVIVRDSDINDALTRVADKLGIPSEFLSTHSLRVGGAFALADGGVSIPLIQLRGRWSQKGYNEMALMYSRLSELRLSALSDAMRASSGTLVNGRK